MSDPISPTTPPPDRARLLETLLASIPDFAYLFDHHGRFLFVNQPLLSLWGMTLEQAVGKNFFQLPYPPELAGKLHRQIRQVFDTGRKLADETIYVNPTGLHGYYEYIFVPVFGADGRVEVVVGSTRNISARRQAELHLAEARAVLAEVFNRSPSFMTVLRGPDHIFELANDRYYELVGNRPLIGKPVREAFPDLAGQGFFELLDRVYTTGEHFAGKDVRVVLRREPGGEQDERFLEFVYQPTRGPDGKINGIFAHGIDVTERKRAEERLARDALLLANVRDSVIVTDLDGVVTFWNAGATKLFGWTAEEMLGRPHLDRLPEPARAEASKWVANIAAGEAEFDGEWLDVRKDGTPVWIEVTTRLIRAPDGSPLGIMGVSRDITERKRAEAERDRLLAAERSAREEAERTSRVKDEFLATLSHELRTPLNAILGWSQILTTEGRTDDDLDEGLRAIQRNARAQTQIIEDLLDMSRIISGKVRLDVRPVELASIARAAAETVKPAAEARQIELGVSIGPHLGTINVDPNRLQQVLWNLLTNAVKFTPVGGRVGLEARRVGGHVEMNVSDTGEGIEPEFLPFVFERFRQADASSTRRHGGLGIGLAIVKQLVELHGGSVAVHSAGAGRGSTFTISLPLSYTPADVSAESQPPAGVAATTDPGPSRAESPQIAGVKVLVVDDEADARALMRRVLVGCGAEVVTAASAAEALELVQSHRPDLLLSDIGMPGEDGLSLIRQVRALDDAAGGNVPAIALTAYASSADRTRAVLAGFQSHLPKPVEPAELIAVIASLTRRSD